MVSITVSVPEETRRLMKEFSEMNWSGFVRKAIEQKTEQLKKLEGLRQRLDEEQTIVDWSVKLQRASRSGRLAALEKKGLL